MVNKAYTEPTEGSDDPAHVKRESEQILADFKAGVRGSENYIEQNISIIEQIVVEQLTDGNEPLWRIIRS